MSVKPVSNYWYHWIPWHMISLGTPGSMTSGCWDYNAINCSVFAVPQADNTTKQWQWQFFKNSENNYTIRNRDAGPSGYLTVFPDTYYDTQIYTVGINNVSNSSTTWAFGTWQTGHFYLYNAYLGSSFRFSLEDYGNGSGTWAWMNPNITDTAAGNATREFELAQLSEIADTKWSTIATTSTSTAATTSASTTVATSASTPAAGSPASISSSGPAASTTTYPSTIAAATTTTTPTPHGLSTGAEAGIGAGVGVPVLLLILLGAFLLFRRRRRSKRAAYTHLSTDLQKQTSPDLIDVETSERHEAYSMPLSELGGSVPAELGGEPAKSNAVQRAK